MADDSWRAQEPTLCLNSKLSCHPRGRGRRAADHPGREQGPGSPDALGSPEEAEDDSAARSRRTVGEEIGPPFAPEGLADSLVGRHGPG
jgi:hypothetical protein